MKKGEHSEESPLSKANGWSKEKTTKSHSTDPDTNQLVDREI